MRCIYIVYVLGCLFCRFTTLQAQSVFPPYREAFEGATLPDRNEWSFSSTADGRIQMASGDVDLAPAAAGNTQSTGANRLRGNIFQASSDRILYAFDQYLELTETQTLSFRVYKASQQAGPYTLLHSQETLAVPGNRFFSSGGMTVPINTGQYYLLAVHWQEENGYRFDNAQVLPLNLSFGNLEQGATLNNVQTLQDTISPQTNNLVYDQRIRSEAVSFSEVPPAGTTMSTQSTANLFRGQRYLQSETRTLSYIQTYLQPGASTTLTFTVHESTTATGAYTELYRGTTSPDTSLGWKSSPRIDVELQAGKYYIIGTHWNQTTQYSFVQNHFLNATQDLGFAEADGGVQLNGPITASHSLSATNNTAYQQRILTLEPASALRMDSAVPNSLSINQAELSLNLQGMEAATLKFFHSSASEEAHDEGIYLSADQTTWFQILSLPDGTSAEAEYTVDLIQAAANAGVTLDSTMTLRLQQQDTHGWPTDGREFRDLRIEAPADVVAGTLTPSLVLPDSFLFRGLNIDKEIDATLNWIQRGGSTDLTEQDLSVELILDAGNAAETTESLLLEDLDFPAMTEMTESRSMTVTVPAATRLPLILYELRLRLDGADSLAESREGNNESTAVVSVNHYSGTLWFDTIETELTISSWETRSFLSSTEHRISGTGTFQGRNFAFVDLDVNKDPVTLDYTVDPAEMQVINLDGIDETTTSGIRYRSSGPLSLNKDGVFGDLEVILPTGLGWTDTPLAQEYQAILPFNGTELTQQLLPENDPVYSNVIWVVEETRPMIFEVNELTWDVAAGKLPMNLTGNSHHVRSDEISSLHNDFISGFIPQNQSFKRSNDAYHHFAKVDANSSLEATTDAQGIALCSYDMEIGSGNLSTHMPYDVNLVWNQAGSVSVVEDQVLAGSQLEGVSIFDVSMLEGCPDGCPGVEPLATLSFKDADEILPFTRDGGLLAEGSLTNTTSFSWGYRQDALNHAHSVSNASVGAFLISGFVLQGDQLGQNESEDAVGVLLNTGSGWGAPLAVERNGSAAYRQGNGVYPGINIRSVDNPGLEALSILGDEVFGTYGLNARSKFYLRRSGVSGIQEVGIIDQNATIYGYQFKFATFSFNYLSSINKDSRTNGSLFLSYPSDLDLTFEELRISCKGDLLEAEPQDPVDPHELDYWQAPLDVFAMAFERDPASCASNSGFLTLQVQSEAAFIPEPIYAKLGFSGGVAGLPPEGNLLRPADAILDIHSRFSVPPSLHVEGPGAEKYLFRPAHDMYLNHYESAAGYQNSGQGFFSLAGDLDVPFFSDIQVQVHTGAGSEASVLHVMGGWPTKGWKIGGNSFFTEQFFDAEHRGFDPGSTLEIYRSNTVEDYQPRALRTWLDVVDLDYPLEWSTVTHSFRSPATVPTAFKVIEVQHQVDYLSPENVELSFGIQYEGLPRLNLANMVFNQIDQATGVASALTEAGADAFIQSLDEGLAGLDETLDPLSQDLMDPVLDELLSPLVDELYTRLNNAYLPGVDYYTDELNTALNSSGGGAAYAMDFEARLASLVGGLNPGEGLGGAVFERLDRAISAVDALNVVDSPNPAQPKSNGILFQDASEDYPVLFDMAGELLELFAAEAAYSLPGGVSQELDAILASAERGLEGVSSLLGEVKTDLSELKDLALPGEEFHAELSASLSPALIQNLSPAIRVRIEQRLLQLPSQRNPFVDVSEAEFKAWLLADFKTEFYGSDIPSNLSSVLRSRIYDIDGRFREAADGLFQQMNSMLREVLSGVLNNLDDSFTDFLDELDAVMGGGSIDGYAHIRGDDLHLLRLDGSFRWKVPDDLEFGGFLQIESLQNSGPASCSFASGEGHRVTVGAVELPCSWLGSDLRVNVQADFTFDGGNLAGLGGSFGFADGSEGINFEAFQIPELDAAVSFGKLENYVAAACRAIFSGSEVAGGAFFGKTCSMDPLVMVDPDIGEVVQSPPFTGAYVFGEAWIPVVDYGCAFNIGAGIGAGLFYFLEGPTFGAKLFLGAKGEALCVVTIRGEIKLIGAKQGGVYRASGSGRLSGKAGVCPLCVKFGKTVRVTWDNGSWDVDY